MSGRRDELLRQVHAVLKDAGKAVAVSMALIERELAIPETTIVGPDGKAEEKCPHLKAEDVSTGGGMPRRAMCMDCGETFKVEAEPKPITEEETHGDYRA